jgi:hypothetical protein
MVIHSTGSTPSAMTAYIIISGSPRSLEKAHTVATMDEPVKHSISKVAPKAAIRLPVRLKACEPAFGAASGLRISCSMAAHMRRMGGKCNNPA